MYMYMYFLVGGCLVGGGGDWGVGRATTRGSGDGSVGGDGRVANDDARHARAREFSVSIPGARQRVDVVAEGAVALAGEVSSVLHGRSTLQGAASGVGGSGQGRAVVVQRPVADWQGCVGGR